MRVQIPCLPLESPFLTQSRNDAKTRSKTELKVQSPCIASLRLGVLALRSGTTHAPMVKWKSCPASNWVFRVRVLVGVLRKGRGMRGERRGPVHVRMTMLRHSSLAPRPWPLILHGVCGVADSARLAVNQEG